MTRRLVVCFRHQREAGSSADFARAAAALVTRASALGGRVVAWDAAAFSIAFGQDAIEDALELVTEEAPEGGVRRGLEPIVSAGLAEGELELISDLGPRAALAQGAVLERAEALSRVAHAGETLLDPALESVSAGRVLTRGSRLGVRAKQRIRGLLLDPEQPLRGDTSVLLARIQTPQRIGARPRLALAPGTLAIVRAERGFGGSRFLVDLGDALALRPVLGEPLGALRVALAQLALEPAALEPEHSATLESVLAAEGLDIESTVSAIAGLLRARGGTPLICVDDVEYIDRDSLEVVSGLLQRGSAAAVVRVTDALPEALTALLVSETIELSASAEPDASELAQAFVSGTLAERARRRWAKRGGGVPLAIREALCEALESGDLIEKDAQIVARARLAGRGTPKPADYFVARRARFVPEAARRLLDLLSIVRAPLTLDELAALVASAGDLTASVRALEQRRWVARNGEQIGLASTTHEEVLQALLDEQERTRLHAEVSRALALSPRPMSAVAAAVHALLAGDIDSALPLARRGSAACRAAGLSETADALARFTESGELSHLLSRGLLAGMSRESADVLESDVPPTTTRRHPSSGPPVAQAPVRGHTTLVGPVGGGPEVAARLTRGLSEKDRPALDALVAELRSDPAQALLADRVEAMVRVAHGELGEALRLSRQAKFDSVMHGPSERARSALAYAVALAAAGRKSEALLEALEGLARAREAADLPGERACARFLAKLSASAGDERAAGVWASLSGA